MFYCEGGETLPRDAQSSCGYPIPGNVQRQAGKGLEPPGLVGDVPAHLKGAGTKLSLSFIPTPQHSDSVITPR